MSQLHAEAHAAIADDKDAIPFEQRPAHALPQFMSPGAARAIGSADYDTRPLADLLHHPSTTRHANADVLAADAARQFEVVRDRCGEAKCCAVTYAEPRLFLWAIATEQHAAADRWRKSHRACIPEKVRDQQGAAQRDDPTTIPELTRSTPEMRAHRERLDAFGTRRMVFCEPRRRVAGDVDEVAGAALDERAVATRPDQEHRLRLRAVGETMASGPIDLQREVEPEVTMMVEADRQVADPRLPGSARCTADFEHARGLADLDDQALDGNRGNLTCHLQGQVAASTLVEPDALRHDGRERDARITVPERRQRALTRWAPQDALRAFGTDQELAIRRGCPTAA